MGEAVAGERRIPGPVRPEPGRRVADVALSVVAWTLIALMTLALLFAAGLGWMVHRWGENVRHTATLGQQVQGTAVRLADLAGDGHLTDVEITTTVGEVWKRHVEGELVILEAPVPGEPRACYEVRLTVPPTAVPSGTLLPGCPTFKARPTD